MHSNSPLLGNNAVRVLSARDGRAQTLVGGGRVGGFADGALGLFAPAAGRRGGGEEVPPARPLWRHGDVLEARDWRRAGRWEADGP